MQQSSRSEEAFTGVISREIYANSCDTGNNFFHHGENGENGENNLNLLRVLCALRGEIFWLSMFDPSFFICYSAGRGLRFPHPMKVALVHDWLTGMRGGERVLEEFCKLFPDATLFTLFHQPGSVTQRIESMPIRTSILNRLPGAGRHYRNLLPLYPWAVSRLDLSGFDLVLSSSHAVAKGIRKPSESVHICYCHTPMRYIWDAQSDYFHYGDPTGIRRTLLAAMKPSLRAWDRATSQSVDYFIANSRNVQDRIARHYSRPAEIVYPP